MRANPLETVGTVLSTFAGPSTAQLDQAGAKSLDGAAKQKLATQKVGAQLAAEAFPANPLKAGEHGLAAGHAPKAGVPLAPRHALDTASTVTENTASPKAGKGAPPAGYNPGNESLDRARVDSGGQMLTTNMGTPIADNQNSLKAGLRGPTLMEDFISPREDHPLRSRANSRAYRSCPRLGRPRFLRGLRLARLDHPRRPIRREG